MDAPTLAPGHGLVAAPAARQPRRRARRRSRAAADRVALLAILVGSVLVRALPALNLDLFIKGPARLRPAGRRDRAGDRRHVRCSSLIADRDRGPGRRARRDLRQRVRPAAARRPGEALARRPERLPVDRDRHLRLRAGRQGEGPDPRHRPPPERLGGRVRALDHHAPARLAHDDGGARARAEQPPRGELRARRLEVADGAERRPADGDRRDRHRHDARGRARRRRDGAAPLHLRATRARS